MVSGIKNVKVIKTKKENQMIKKIMIGLGIVVLGACAKADDKCQITIQEHAVKIDELLQESDNAFNFYGDKIMSRDAFREALDLAVHCGLKHKEDYTPEQYNRVGYLIGQMRRTLESFDAEISLDRIKKGKY